MMRSSPPTSAPICTPPSSTHRPVSPSTIISSSSSLGTTMSGASPTRCLTSPATSTPSATHNFLYKTSKTAPKGAVFLIFRAIVITVFCYNNDVLLEKLSDIQEPLSQLHIGIILSDIKDSSRICSAFSHSFGTFISTVTFSHIALLGKLYILLFKKKEHI